MEGNKELPLVIGERGGNDNDNDNDNDDDDDDDDDEEKMIEEITETTETTNNNNNNNNNGDNQTIQLALNKKTTTMTEEPTTTTTTAAAATNNFDMTTCAREYMEKIYNNVNHFKNTFGEKEEEYAVTETVTRRRCSPTLDVYERSEDEEPPRGGFSLLLQWKLPTKLHKRTILDQAIKIWTTRIANTKDGDFNFQGGFKGVLQKDWNDKREADPTIGTKRTKAELNEFVDEKFAKVVINGIYKPFDDMHDLLKLLTMELGQQFAIRGELELSSLLRAWVWLGSFGWGHMKGLKYAIIALGGGFDKAHKLSLDNPLVTKQFPMVVEDTSNPFCVINKLISFYRERCKPDQSQFFGHVNTGHKKGLIYYFKPRSPAGQDSLRKWTKEFAEVADFKDWEKYTPRDNWHQCCTILALDLSISEKVQMNHPRHKHVKSSEPYIHQSSKLQAAV
eukprot:jgi/Psemu1/40940/gm1.40940_g